MKLILALLAMITGFAVADGVRVAEPVISEGDGAVRGAWVSDEARPDVAIASVLLVAVTLPLALLSAPAMRWASKPAPFRADLTVHRSDRLLQ